MLDLLDGLELMDESLYREWVLTHPERNPEAGENASSEIRLSFHRYTQETMLLADMRNMMAAIINSKRDPKAKEDPISPVLMPYAGEQPGKASGSGLADMQAMFSKFSHK